MPNHLNKETSPYLLQHVDNPVDWYPWGEEALTRASSENKPILLSIGYAACHWCHVMAHESFEDEATAELMNRWFVNIKVDREERPDLDSIYMAAVTSMTGHGGWPMTVFLSPQGKPFYGGTYYPKEARYGMPAFSQILSGVAEAWKTRHDEVQKSAENITQQLQAGLAVASKQEFNGEILLEATRGISAGFDSQWGGFGSAPKFPQPMVLEFLLREYLRSDDQAAIDMLTLTLRKMAQGGMYDQLGGGFARYSTDQEWLVPHFEKMLYDNAQLARIYLRAYQVSGEDYFRQIVEQTLDYVLREMTHEQGGFYSSQDADSEGEEGKFFVWSADEIRELLGVDAELFNSVHGVSEEGNWEGKNILHLAESPSLVAEKMGLSQHMARESLSRSRKSLFAARSLRIWPGLDDKIVTAWNGLMMSAFAEAGRVLARDDYLAAATANAEFLQKELTGTDGRLMRTWKAGGPAKYNAYLEDYACLAEGLLSLYEAGFESRWFAWAEELAQVMMGHYRAADQPGFYDTSDDHETLIHRPRDLQDNAMPSGNAKAAMVLFRLGLYTGKTEFLEAAEQSIPLVVGLISRYPSGFGEWLNVASFMLGRTRELALIGPADQLDDFRKVLNQQYHPWLVVAAGADKDNEPALLSQRLMLAGKPTAYLCERFSCLAPITESSVLDELLNGRA